MGNLILILSLFLIVRDILGKNKKNNSNRNGNKPIDGDEFSKKADELVRKADDFVQKTAKEFKRQAKNLENRSVTQKNYRKSTSGTYKNSPKSNSRANSRKTDSKKQKKDDLIGKLVDIAKEAESKYISHEKNQKYKSSHGKIFNGDAHKSSDSDAEAADAFELSVPEIKHIGIDMNEKKDTPKQNLKIQINPVDMIIYSEIMQKPLALRKK